MMHFLFLVLVFVLEASSHSMMTCAVTSGTGCSGAVRNSAASMQSTNYRFDDTNPCQPEARGVNNLASKYSSANPMGVLSSGQSFSVRWPARNHAVANQNPRVVKVYLSPRSIEAGQTNDFTWPQFAANMICSDTYINCGNGKGVDTLGDDIPCTLDCVFPTVANGIYTLLWHWNWTQNDGENYMTCADIQVGASSGFPSVASSVIGTSNRAATTNQRTSSSQRATTKESLGATLASSQNQETKSTNCNDASYCTETCGDQPVESCTCIDGFLSVVCADAGSGSSLLASMMFIVYILYLFV